MKIKRRLPFVKTWRCPVSEYLGTRFDNFISSTGISGLARVGQNRIDILAVIAERPGTGQLRRFIEGCKARYSTVGVWDVLNDDLASALIRYGFEPGILEQDDGPVDGFIWNRKP